MTLAIPALMKLRQGVCAIFEDNSLWIQSKILSQNQSINQLINNEQKFSMLILACFGGYLPYTMPDAFQK